MDSGRKLEDKTKDKYFIGSKNRSNILTYKQVSFSVYLRFRTLKDYKEHIIRS